jgi:hypothetical protein
MRVHAFLVQIVKEFNPSAQLGIMGFQTPARRRRSFLSRFLF